MEVSKWNGRSEPIGEIVAFAGFFVIGVAVKNLKSRGLEPISDVDSGNLIVLRATEFGIVLPQIGFRLFEGIQEAKTGDGTLSDRGQA